MTLPFLAQAEWVETTGAVHGKYTVEMVNLVLQELGERALGVNAVASSSQVLVLHRDAVRPLDPDHEVRKREAIIPNQEILIADIHDFRVDHGEALGVLNDKDQPDGCADLGSGDASAAAVALLPVAERIPQVVRHHPDRRGTGIVDGLAPSPKDRVPEEANAVNRHTPNLWPDEAGERRRQW